MVHEGSITNTCENCIIQMYWLPSATRYVGLSRKTSLHQFFHLLPMPPTNAGYHLMCSMSAHPPTRLPANVPKSPQMELGGLRHKSYGHGDHFLLLARSDQKSGSKNAKLEVVFKVQKLAPSAWFALRFACWTTCILHNESSSLQTRDIGVSILHWIYIEGRWMMR